MQTTPSSRNALRVLITLLAVTIGIVIYAYGWNTTEISLDEIQDPVRQTSLKRAMRELLSPDIFTRDSKIESYMVTFTIGCPAGDDAALPDARAESEQGAYVIFDPPCADTDDIIHVQGYGFPDHAIARIQLFRESGQNLPFKLADLATQEEEEDEVSEVSIFDLAEDGSFAVDVKVPRGRGLRGDNQVQILTAVPHGTPRFSGTTETVLDKMLETIFLALMATTLALPVAVVISFTAARNLMRQVTLPLGNVLVGFVMLPLGGWLGAQLLGPLGETGVEWGENLSKHIIDLVIALVALGAASWALTWLEQRLLGTLSASTTSAAIIRRVRGVLANALLLVVLVLIVGVLGGLGMRLSEALTGDIADTAGDWTLDAGEAGGVDLRLSGDWFGDMANNLGSFIGTLGELVDLLVVGIAALGGALWLSSLVAGLSARPLRVLKSPFTYLLGALLGTLSGAILLGALAFIGMQAVLMTLLIPIVAAVMGGQLVLILAGRLLPDVIHLRRPKAAQSNFERTLRTVITLAASIAVFIITAWIMNIIRSVVDGRLPLPTTIDIDLFGTHLFTVRKYIFEAGAIGAVLGGLAAGLMGTHTTFPLGMAVYNTSRAILNTLRSIEPLIMGIVFVIWVGVGPFAGVLALTLHSIAALGKLYSEQVENIDAGPIEAIQSTGANRLQTIIYAVVPQIVPPYIAFTMYRWDINVRMSTIIGFVGGGGIGFLLQQQINLLRYRQAGVAVLAIAIVVSVLDYASAAIRERIV